MENKLNDEFETKVPRRFCSKKSFVRWLNGNRLLVLTFAGVLLGAVVGFSVRTLHPSEDAVMLILFPGELLIRTLKLIILPLIVSSLISGLCQLDAAACGRMGVRVVCYYLVTTSASIIIGISCVLIIHPGNPNTRSQLDDDDDGGGGRSRMTTTLDAFLTLLRNMFPENLIQACFQIQKTVYEVKRSSAGHAPSPSSASPNNSLSLDSSSSVAFDLSSSQTDNETDGSRQAGEVFVRNLVYSDGINIMGLIVFCIVFGIVMGKMGEKVKVMKEFFLALNDVIMKIVELVMWYSPFGIMCLIAGRIISLPDLATTAEQLGLYITTVLTGLVIHLFGTIFLLYFAVTRKNPFAYFKGILEAWMTAIGTDSSTATIPVAMHCVEENLGVDRRVSRFVLPIGATVNVDGNALYEAVAAIFVAQMHGISLSVGKIITISLTATFASVGSGSVPSAGLFTMILVLTAVGLPLQDISLLVSVDWLMDRIRTSVTVAGDCFGAGIVHHLSQKELKATNEEGEEEEEEEKLNEPNTIEDGLPLNHIPVE